MDTAVDHQALEDDDDIYVPRSRKSKRRLVQLHNLRPSVWFQTSAVVGPPDSPTYVIEVEVDGQKFQGISQSKKKAKVMAAEYALMYLGEIDSLTEAPPSPVFVPQPSYADDFSADVVFPTKLKSSLLYDFSRAEERDMDDQGDYRTELMTSPNKPGTDSCNDDLPKELQEWNENDLRFQLIGKNPLTIIGEMQIDASYLLLAKSDDPLNPMFAVAAVVDGETFQAAGNSKKVAKARAARDALHKLYNLEFGISENVHSVPLTTPPFSDCRQTVAHSSEGKLPLDLTQLPMTSIGCFSDSQNNNDRDGMPIYEGDDRIWQHYKAKLEQEAVIQLQPKNNPLMLLTEYFPDIEIVEGPVLDGSVLFTASLTVFDEVYSGVGMTKLDAKTNAAANAVEALHRNGVITARQKEREAERREADWLKQHSEGPLEIPRYDHRMFAVQKNAAAKLNVIYKNLEYVELCETRIPRADLMAFVVAVTVEGRTYVGVGKTKREARCEAAEKALRYLRLWTDRDEQNKRVMLYGIEEEDPVEMVLRLRAAAGHPPDCEEWETPSDHGLQSCWDSNHPSGSWDEGHSHTFDVNGPPPGHFHGPDFRRSIFPHRGRFNNGPLGARPPGRHQLAFDGDYNGQRPSQPGFSRGGRNPEIFNKAAPNQTGCGRGYDTGRVSHPPGGLGNTPVMRGIPRGGVDFGHMENRNVIPSPRPQRASRFGPPMHANRAATQHQNEPVIQSNNAGPVRTRSKSNSTGELQSLQHITPVRPVVPQASSASNFSYIPVPDSASNALQTTVSSCSQWNPVLSTSLLYGQQISASVTNSVYPNATVNASTGSCTAASSDQYNMGTVWPDATQANYIAYYNSYLQNMGMSDMSNYINMSVVCTAANNTVSSSATQTEAAYASQAMAYANSAATYYNTFYGAGGYADPSQNQMYNYMYCQSNSKPT